MPAIFVLSSVVLIMALNQLKLARITPNAKTPGRLSTYRAFSFPGYRFCHLIQTPSMNMVNRNTNLTAAYRP
jgi:hypothetical protein